MIQWGMPKEASNLGRVDASVALLDAIEAMDFMGFVEALDAGANPRASDDSANPAWQLLLTKPKSSALDEADRAAMFSALLEAGVWTDFYVFCVMAEDIEHLDLKECASVLFRSLLDSQNTAHAEKCISFLYADNPWWADLISQKEARDLDASTPATPSRSAPRL